MKSLKYSEILAGNRELGRYAVGRPYRIALLSNIVINQLGEILEYMLRRQGINADVIYGSFDNIVQDTIQLKDVDAAVVFWEVANLVEDFSSKSAAMGEDQLDLLVERVEREMEMAIRNLQDIPLVLFNRFSALLFEHDDLRDGVLQRLSNRLNAFLDRIVYHHQIIVKTDWVIAKVGLAVAADFRQFQSTKALYSIEFLKTYADYVVPAFLAVTGKQRKILVLDCDNTLWGGVLGEDGDSQIQMNSSTRCGRIFREVQQILQGFHKRGILLALCSKNNAVDVNRILTLHPDMVLRDSDFVNKKINWQDKASNLRQMSEELNVGLDSFVFVDDSSFEIGLVQDELPQVKSIRVPETLSDYPSALRRMVRDFFVFSYTSEDLHKTEMYRQEQVRVETKARFESLDDYLISLGLVVRVAWNEAISVERVSQLTLKTNQFNLTTRRYAEADIARMLSDEHFIVTSFAVSDRYGDYGTTGLAIIKLMPDGVSACIDTILMSCRVIGRKVELAFFDFLVVKLQAMGFEKLYAEYFKTQKNDQVSLYYDTLSFYKIQECSDMKSYVLNLDDYRRSGINYIEVRGYDN